MKNLRRHKDALISLPLPVPAGLDAGAPVKLGDSGLRGVLKTARATAETYANGTCAPGLQAGEATVTLIGVSLSMTYMVAGPVALLAKVYFDADGVVSTDETGTPLGVALNALAGPGTLEVGLI